MAAKIKLSKAKVELAPDPIVEEPDLFPETVQKRVQAAAEEVGSGAHGYGRGGTYRSIGGGKRVKV